MVQNINLPPPEDIFKMFRQEAGPAISNNPFINFIVEGNKGNWDINSGPQAPPPSVDIPGAFTAVGNKIPNAPRGAVAPSQSKLIEEGVIKFENTARGQRSEEAAWIDNLDNETYNRGMKSVTDATGVVLQNSGLKVSPDVAMAFRKGAQDQIVAYNQQAKHNERTPMHYYELLTGYLMMLDEAEKNPTQPDESGEQIPQGWNPNTPPQYQPIESGMNSLAVRQNQMAYNTPEEASAAQNGGGGVGLAGILNAVYPGFTGPANLAYKVLGR